MKTTAETETKTPKQARIYGRFSSKPQEKGDSMRRQIDGGTAYAQKMGFAIIGKPYFDEGVSGKAGANLRLELGRCINDTKRGEIIVVELQDRLGRQHPIELMHLLYELVTKKGASIHIWQENLIIDETTIEEFGSQVKMFVGAAIGNQENKRKMFRLRETWDKTLALARKGIPTVNLTKCLPQVFYWDDAAKQFKANEEIKKTIRRIFQEYVSGMGKTAIAQGLNRDNVPTLYKGKGQVIGEKKPWLETSIKKILLNKGYNGTVVIKGEAFTGLIPKIIQDDVFQKAQMFLVRHVQRHGKQSERFRTNNLFAGIAYCADCGGTINVNPSMSGNQKGFNYYYRCKNARLKMCKHPHKMIKSELVEYGFFKTFFGKGAASLLRDDNRNVALKEKIEVQKNIIADLEKRISNLYDDIEKGDKEASRRKDVRLGELVKAQAELTTLEGEIKEDNCFDDNINVIYGTITIKDIWGGKPKMFIDEILSDQTKRKKLVQVLPSIFSRITFDCPNGLIEAFSKDGASLGKFSIKDFEKELSQSVRMITKPAQGQGEADFEPPKRTFKPRQTHAKGQTAKQKVADYLAKQ